MTSFGAAPSPNPQPAPALGDPLPELVTAFSLALDAAEGAAPGHAARVALLATLLALDDQQQRAAFHAGHLHDVGIPLVAAQLASVPGLDEETLFALPSSLALTDLELSEEDRTAATQALHEHVSAPSLLLTHPWLPLATADAVRFSHENWDGSGYPHGAQGETIPLLARLLRAADLFTVFASDVDNPLGARVGCRAFVESWSGRQLQPEIARALTTVAGDDAFWLRFYDCGITDTLTTTVPSGSLQAGHPLICSFSETVAGMIDRKASHAPGRARRVAHYARAIAAALETPSEELDTIALAALWVDVGTLGVPSRILAKRDLLTLAEMQWLRRHPLLSAKVVRRIAVLRHAEPWVAAHHERVDGRGYLQMLAGAEIPTQAGILSLADGYVAMTSPRPYRDALPVDEAIAKLETGAGSQWDPFLVKVLLDILDAEGHGRDDSANADGPGL